jgi:hypothetical protein
MGVQYVDYFTTQLSVGAGGVGVVTVFHRFGLSTAYQGQFQLTDSCVTGGPLSTTRINFELHLQAVCGRCCGAGKATPSAADNFRGP